jgi:hypothetical protein
MNKDTANFLLFAGLLIAFIGVGSIEVSQTSDEMMGGMIISIVGLLTSYCGILAHRVLDNQ